MRASWMMSAWMTGLVGCIGSTRVSAVQDSAVQDSAVQDGRSLVDGGGTSTVLDCIPRDGGCSAGCTAVWGWIHDSTRQCRGPLEFLTCAIIHGGSGTVGCLRRNADGLYAVTTESDPTGGGRPVAGFTGCVWPREQPLYTTTCPTPP